MGHGWKDLQLTGARLARPFVRRERVKLLALPLLLVAVSSSAAPPLPPVPAVPGPSEPIVIVSKNGNLLINVVQRPDGSRDPEVEQMLGQLADWTEINGEALYGTRPWTTWGEGPVRIEGGHFREDAAFTAQDVRFTTKGGTLYAFSLGWPEKALTIRALGTAAGRVSGVRRLGHQGRLEWTQDARGLKITVPERRPCDHAFAFAIAGLLPAAAAPGPEGAR